MLPIATLPPSDATSLRYVLMDIDDTITSHGVLLPEAYDALWKLHESGLILVAISGCSLGWCDLIVHQWPLDAVIGENGAMVYWREGDVIHRDAHPNAVPNSHPILQELSRRIPIEVPGSRVAPDQFCRLYDLAIAYADEAPRLSIREASEIERICLEAGARARMSSIHVNVWMGDWSKLDMTLRFLSSRYGYNDQTDKPTAMYIGDSPNDEPMFAHFPLSTAVSSIHGYVDRMEHLPLYVAGSPGGHGFAETAEMIIRKRQ